MPTSETDSGTQQFEYVEERHFSADVITRCLTDSCQDCSGSYSNNIVGHRLICKCHCHRSEVTSV
jgi:hypothetical protein